MVVDSLVANDDLVAALQKNIGRGEWGLSEVPTTLKLVIDNELWRARVVQQTGEEARFDSFARFVTAPLVEGLGTDLATLKRLCRDDPEALNALDKATLGQQGLRTDLLDNIQEVPVAPTGTSAQRALRKLRKDRADLHARVLAGELSPHAAMVQAGYRRSTATVPIDDIPKLAATLRRRLTADQLAALREALQ